MYACVCGVFLSLVFCRLLLGWVPAKEAVGVSRDSGRALGMSGVRSREEGLLGSVDGHPSELAVAGKDAETSEAGLSTAVTDAPLGPDSPLRAR